MRSTTRGAGRAAATQQQATARRFFRSDSSHHLGKRTINQSIRGEKIAAKALNGEKLLDGDLTRGKEREKVRVWGMTKWSGCIFSFSFRPLISFLVRTKKYSVQISTTEQRTKQTRIPKRTRYLSRMFLVKNNNYWQAPGNPSCEDRIDPDGTYLSLPGGMMSISAMGVCISFRSCRRPVNISRLLFAKVAVSLECN
jgi:hypothetical protein